MSPLAKKIIEAMQHKKCIWIDEMDGTSHSVSTSDSDIIIKGENCEYIKVKRQNSENLYNLSLIKSIRIS